MTRAASVVLSLGLLITGCGSSGSGVSTAPSDGSPSVPGASEPGAAYTIAPDGPATEDAAFKRCLTLPGVASKQPFVANPVIFRVTASGGEPIEAFEACMKYTPGYASLPIADAEASFIEQCTGDQKQYVVPFYIGMTEQVALEAQPPTTARVPVRSARVTARDGDCLPVTVDLRPDRADLVVQNGVVIWAGVPDPTATGSTTGQG
jgi:hypothetical protein